ncbi:thermonuclease family protein [Candidatus Microgenomates bacterium]|nr:thermonuclease family protein [Candidatus Microgenomates bacterium]
MIKFLPVLILALVASILLNAKLLTQKSSLATFKVTEVIDGDTFKIDSEGGKRVRLIGIDAPELDRCLAQEAKQKLTDLVLGKEVALTDQFSDPYGRIMANVFVGKTYVNKEVLAAGLGRMDYMNHTRREELKAAYAQVLAAKLGIAGSTCIQLAPSKIGCLIKGNIDDLNKGSYYRPDCRGYGNVTVNTAFGESWFCSEKEAVAAGFSRAASCNAQ